MGWGTIIFLIIVGVVLMIFDFLVIPGIVVTIVGLLCMVGGVVMAFMQYGTTAGLITLLCTAAFTITMIVLMLRSKTWKRLQLNTKIDSKVNEIDANKFTVGMVGKAISRLAPMGTGQFGDKFVEVTSPQNFIDVNSDIVITKIEGNKIFVNQNNTL